MDGNTHALELIFSRNAFYKRLHYLAFGAFCLSLIIIGLLISVLTYLLSNPVHPIYFATDTVSRLIQIVPVNVPNMTQAQVDAWTVEAVQATLSMDYINYRAQLQNAQKYFTSWGWSKYMSALMASNNLLGVTQRRQIVFATVVAQPKITAQGILGGSYAWKYEMPVLLTFSEPPYDDEHKFSNAWTVSVIVQRQQVLQGYKGLGIAQMIAREAAGTQQQQISGTSTN